jgi:tRNA G10  N-methylase Trm11
MKKCIAGRHFGKNSSCKISSFALSHDGNSMPTDKSKIRPSSSSPTVESNLNSKISSVATTNAIDTSLLYEELRRKFNRDAGPVEVDFRKLVDWVKLGDQLTHQIHPYPAKLLPSIAHFFMRAGAIVKPGSKVLDPFCGSGTVALEASLAGHTPLVADANPLSLLITKVKTTRYDVSELRAITSKVVQRAARLRNAPEISVVNSQMWYEPQRKKDLEILMRAIQEVEDSQHRDFLLLCFSVVARKLSLADPAISVPVRLKTKESFSAEINARILSKLAWVSSAIPRDEFFNICNSNIERIARTNAVFPYRNSVTVVGQDARKLLDPQQAVESPLAANSIPLIVTSPPYGSAQKYIRASSLSLNWLGFVSPRELSALEGRSIGREHAPGIHEVTTDRIPKSFTSLLNDIKSINALRHHITAQYLHDMRDALEESARVLASGGKLILVLGNNHVCGKQLRNDEYCIEILEGLGLRLDLNLVDNIKSRGLLTKRNSAASAILRESVLVFSK